VRRQHCDIADVRAVGAVRERASGADESPVLAREAAVGLFANTVASPAALLLPSGAARYSASSSAQSMPSME